MGDMQLGSKPPSSLPLPPPAICVSWYVGQIYDPNCRTCCLQNPKKYVRHWDYILVVKEIKCNNSYFTFLVIFSKPQNTRHLKPSWNFIILSKLSKSFALFIIRLTLYTIAGADRDTFVKLFYLQVALDQWLYRSN